MCGIVAYKGHKNCHPILVNGLKRLEYRGYDSAGIASINSNNNLVVTKRKGKVSELESVLPNSEIYIIGKKYKVVDIKVHSQHTKIKLKGIEGWFNSVCFQKH